MPEPVAPDPKRSDATSAFPSSQYPAAGRSGSTNHGELDWFPSANDRGPPEADRYRAVRLHASGGLGEVYIAQDREIDRKVALKRMQSRFTRFEIPRLRFLREAEITGQLEHPGIVPVYGLVRDAAGVPYYAMRFIEGESLQAALERFHDPGRSWTDAVARRLALRQLVIAVVAASNAVAYAHSRGVIHRDLKPANIMLGRFGETLVVDWGLAKRTGEPAPADCDDALPAANDTAGDETLTKPGTYAGTAAFMSPEQASGDWERVGPASDVYGLGATLYAVLTGRPPIDAGTSLTKLERARDGRFAPPRKIKPWVSRPLEAICLKAMAKEMTGRYPTAPALADDLEKYLAGEPVAAYPEPLPDRVKRWVRRNSRAVTLAAGTLVVALAYLATFVWFLDRQNQQVRESEQQARRLVGALHSVFEPADPIGLNDITRSAGLPAAAQAAASEYLVEKLEGLLAVAEPPLNARVRAIVQRALGNAYRSLVKFPEAERHLAAALAACQAAYPPDDPERAAAHHQYGWLLHDQGELDEALHHYEQALASHRSRTPPDPLAIAAVEFNIAYLFAMTGDAVRAEELFQRVLETRVAELGAEHRSVAVAQVALAALYLDVDRQDDALVLVRQAGPTLLKHEGAEGMMNAAVQFQVAMLKDAAGQTEEAVEQMKGLVGFITRSRLGERHWVMCLVRHELGRLYGKQKRHDEAVAELSAARDLAAELYHWRHPKMIEAVAGLANALRRRNDVDAGVREFETLLKQFRNGFGNEHVFTADAMVAFADFLLSAKQGARAEALLDGAIVIYGRPAVVTGRRYGPALTLRAARHLRLGRYERALADADAAMTPLARLAGAKHTDVLEARVLRGTALAHLGRSAEAATELDAALIAVPGMNVNEADVLYDAAMVRARLALSAGRPDQAEPLAERASTLARNYFRANEAPAAEAFLLRADIATAGGRRALAATRLADARDRLELGGGTGEDLLGETLRRQWISALLRGKPELAADARDRMSELTAERRGLLVKASRCSALDADAAGLAAQLVEATPAAQSDAEFQAFGALNVLAGKTDEGVRMLEQAKSKASGRPTVWEDLFLALAKHRSGDRDTAVDFFRRAQDAMNRPSAPPKWNETATWVPEAELRLARDRVATLIKQ